jgi:hypothetical protein
VYVISYFVSRGEKGRWLIIVYPYIYINEQISYYINEFEFKPYIFSAVKGAVTFITIFLQIDVTVHNST